MQNKGMNKGVLTNRGLRRRVARSTTLTGQSVEGLRNGRAVFQ